MNSLQRETLAKHPNPPTTPLEALAHVIAVYEGEPDERVVITATTHIYPEAPWTGLRLGDLRSLLRDHAHELAEEQRELLRRGFRQEPYASVLNSPWRFEPLGTTHVIDHIDPEIKEVRPARVALAELYPKEGQ